MGRLFKKALAMLVLLLSLGVAGSFGQSAPKKVTRAEAMSAVTSKIQPAYPAIAQQLKIEGAVELEVLVTDGGAVESVTIISGNPVLTKPAAEAVKKWKFSPFQQDGKAVQAVAPVTVVFKR